MRGQKYVVKAHEAVEPIGAEATRVVEWKNEFEA